MSTTDNTDRREAGSPPAEFLAFQDVWERVDLNESNASSRLKFAAISSRYPAAPADAAAMWIADMDTKPLSEISALVAECALKSYGYQTCDIGEAVQRWYETQQIPLRTENEKFRLEKAYLENVQTVKSSSVVSVASVIGAVDVALKTFCLPGDEVMVLTPTYGPLIDSIDNNSLKACSIHAERDENGNDTINVDLLPQSATALVLCHPNNPTGQVLSAPCQTEVIRFCNKHGILIITDEVHSEFGFLSNDEPQAIPLFGAHCNNEAKKGIIHISSVSKAFNLAAIPGASYAIIEDAEVREKFHAAITSRHLEASYLSQVALQAAYSLGHSWLRRIRSALGLNRKLVRFYFEHHGICCDYTMGRAGYFLWLKLSKSTMRVAANLEVGSNKSKATFSPASSFDECVHRGVIGSDGEQFNAPGWVRLNLACHPLQIYEALTKLFFR